MSERPAVEITPETIKRIAQRVVELLHQSHLLESADGGADGRQTS
jgi:hypothetical protein